jgi:cell wall-associated NlpC family hydrolase
MAKVMEFACSQIGKMYKFATAGPTTYDCSGLVKAAWAQVGVNLPHQSRAQRSSTKAISRSELRPGDIIFFYSPIHHVGLYAGKVNGVDWMVHANRAGVPLHMRSIDKAGPITGYGRVGG